MLQNLFIAIKKWATFRQSGTPYPKTLGQEEGESQDGKKTGGKPGQPETPADLDEATANEIVTTWNILNPP